MGRYKEYIIRHLPKSWLLLAELWHYGRRLTRYNAAFDTDSDLHKMQYTLLRENHVIEKGMSMRAPRTGFGQPKVKALMARLSTYYDRYGDRDKSFMCYPLATIKAYITYMKQCHVDMSAIEQTFVQLCGKAGFAMEALDKPAGVSFVRREAVSGEAKGDFRSLLFSRHSIRYFQPEIPSDEQILQALELAARTPSACNRQAWHTHVYRGEQSHRLLEQQGGCSGFTDDVHCAIVVTADMKGFLDYEPFQCYVDGGLYAMNLVNALHYVGLGTIPLSCGFYSRKLRVIQRNFDIPENEVMIMIVGVGVLTDEVKIAVSTRKPIEATNTFH